MLIRVATRTPGCECPLGWLDHTPTGCLALELDAWQSQSLTDVHTRESLVGVGGLLAEEVAVPTAGSEQDSAGLVLEHPPHEIATGPAGEADQPDSTADQQWTFQPTVEHVRHAVVGEEVMMYG